VRGPGKRRFLFALFFGENLQFRENVIWPHKKRTLGSGWCWVTALFQVTWQLLSPSLGARTAVR
jgi:hypothetical protein